MASEYRIRKELAERHTGVHIHDRMGQFDHRGMVLRATCELENELGALLLAFFKSQNSTLAEARVRKDLFSENGFLSSLGRMTKLAGYLGLISDDEAHDFRCITALRNQYAHVPRRDQFYRDPEAAEQVRELKLFRNSEDIFEGFDEQGIFLACKEHLVAILQARSTLITESQNVNKVLD